MELNKICFYDATIQGWFLVKEKRIKISITENSVKPYYVYADKERIRQVIVNLLVNSIKYEKNNGANEISFTDNKESVIVELMDNGIGKQRTFAAFI